MCFNQTRADGSVALIMLKTGSTSAILGNRKN